MVEHYYSKKQTSKLKTAQIEADLRGFHFKFIVGSGTFSKSAVDFGSKLLIEKCEIKKGQRVLDLGCGWGAVGIVMAKLGCDVLMTDSNERAVMLAKKNTKLNKVVAKAVSADMYEKVDGEFDTILLNPPHTAGKKICIAMIEQAKNYLKSGGTLQIVARHQKGGKDLAKYMENTFGNVTHIAKQGGFRVYLSKKEE